MRGKIFVAWNHSFGAAAVGLPLLSPIRPLQIGINLLEAEAPRKRI
jgi:hypothetical protein